MQPEDLVVTDLDSDGSPELAYVFTYGDEIRQYSHLRAFQTDNGPPGLLSLDWSYPGDIDLQLGGDGLVQALGIPMASPSVSHSVQ